MYQIHSNPLNGLRGTTVKLDHTCKRVRITNLTEYFEIVSERAFKTEKKAIYQVSL